MGQKLTDDEIDALERQTRRLYSATRNAGIMPKESNESQYYRSFDPDEIVRTNAYDRAKLEYTNKIVEVTGAELRQAMVIMKAYSAKKKLDGAGKDLLSQALYHKPWREFVPKDEYDAGLEQMSKYAVMVGGEQQASLDAEAQQLKAQPPVPQKAEGNAPVKSSMRPRLKFDDEMLALAQEVGVTLPGNQSPIPERQLASAAPSTTPTGIPGFAGIPGVMLADPTAKQEPLSDKLRGALALAAGGRTPGGK